MMTRWNTRALRGFEFFFRPWMRRRLAGIYVAGLPASLPADRPIVLAANHVSWWDGFLLRELHRLAETSAPLFTLMQEDQLQRFPFFRWMGVMGISPQSPGSVLNVLHSLRSLRQQHPDLWLSVFPQGQIWPSWKRPLAFQRGLVWFSDLLAPAVVLPVGLHLQTLDHPAPSAFVSVGAPMKVEEGETLTLENVEQRVIEALDRTFALLETYGESTPLHWPGPHDLLPNVRAHQILPGSARRPMLSPRIF